MNIFRSKQSKLESTKIVKNKKKNQIQILPDIEIFREEKKTKIMIQFDDDFTKRKMNVKISFDK